MAVGAQVRHDRDLNCRVGEQWRGNRQMRGNSEGVLGD